MQLFVWDFHGVLEKGSEKRNLILLNYALQEKGLHERFSEEGIERVRGKKFEDSFAAILHNTNTSSGRQLNRELESIAWAYSREHPELIEQFSHSTEYSHEVLAKIKEDRHSKQILISNCHPASLNKFMEVTGTNNKYFDAVYPVSSQSHFQHKSDALKAYTENMEFDKYVFIGDTPKDIELANEINSQNIKTYLYIQSEHEFKFNRRPDKIITDLREVLGELE